MIFQIFRHRVIGFILDKCSGGNWTGDEVYFGFNTNKKEVKSTSQWSDSFAVKYSFARLLDTTARGFHVLIIFLVLVMLSTSGLSATEATSESKPSENGTSVSNAKLSALFEGGITKEKLDDALRIYIESHQDANQALLQGIAQSDKKQVISALKKGASLLATDANQQTAGELLRSASNREIAGIYDKFMQKMVKRLESAPQHLPRLYLNCWRKAWSRLYPLVPMVRPPYT